MTVKNVTVITAKNNWKIFCRMFPGHVFRVAISANQARGYTIS